MNHKQIKRFEDLMISKSPSRSEVILIIITALLRTGSMYFYGMSSYSRRNVPMPFYLLLNFIAALIVLGAVFAGTKALLLRCGCKKGQAGLLKAADMSSGTSSKRFFLIFLIALAVIWLPFLIIRYPGAMNADTWLMIVEYDRDVVSEFQSVFYACFLGGTLRFFKFLTGSENTGLFVFVLIHFVLYAAVFAYSLNLMLRLRCPKVFLALTFLIYAADPYITGYIGVAMKDSLYSVLVFLNLLILIDIYAFAPGSLRSFKYALLILSIVFSCLTRKNGIYIYIALLLWLLVKTFRADGKGKGEPPRGSGFLNTNALFDLRVAVEISLALYLLIFLLMRLLIVPVPDIKAERYSIPFQQTARLVRDHGDELTLQERDIIDKVLKIDTLAGRYAPRHSDPVKDEANTDPEVMTPYLKLWFRQFFKYPVTYIAATWEQNYYFFVPEAEVYDQAYYMDAITGYELGEFIEIEAFPDRFETNIFKDLKGRLIKYEISLHRLPVLNLFWNHSFAFYLLIIMTFFFMRQKKFNGILLILWMSMLCVVIAPAMHGHPRFLFAMNYSLPALLAFFFYSLGSASEFTDKAAGRQDS